MKLISKALFHLSRTSFFAVLVFTLIFSSFFWPSSAFADTNISACGTLSTAGMTYVLTQNLSGATCLTITADNIIVDGVGHTITGGVVASGVGSGAPGHIITFRNITISSAITANGVAGSTVGAPNGGNGGNITIQNAHVASVNANGGSGRSIVSGGGFGGTGGTIVVATSTATNITARGGVANSRSAGGAGGSITFTNSTATSLQVGGGNGSGTDSASGTINTAGGAGGSITVIDSTLNAGMVATGGNGAPGVTAVRTGGIGGNGGPITVLNSTIVGGGSLGGVGGTGFATSAGSNGTDAGGGFPGTNGADGTDTGGTGGMGGNGGTFTVTTTTVTDSLDVSGGAGGTGGNGSAGGQGGSGEQDGNSFHSAPGNGGKGATGGNGGQGGNGGTLNIISSSVTNSLLSQGGVGGDGGSASGGSGGQGYQGSPGTDNSANSCTDGGNGGDGGQGGVGGDAGNGGNAGAGGNGGTINITNGIGTLNTDVTGGPAGNAVGTGSAAGGGGSGGFGGTGGGGGGPMYDGDFNVICGNGAQGTSGNQGPTGTTGNMGTDGLDSVPGTDGMVNVLDVTLPTVSLDAPTNGSMLSGASVALEATAADDTAVAGVKFYIDGTLIGSEDTTSAYTGVLDSTLQTNGAHILNAVARDTSNNYATSTDVSVTINNVAPPGPTEEDDSPVEAPRPPSSSRSTATAYSQMVIDTNPGTPNNFSISDIENRLASLRAQILALLQNTSVSYSLPTVLSDQKLSTCPEMEEGYIGPCARLLQQFLNSQNFIVAKEGLGSPGNESGRFGSATKAALILFQKANTITPSVGYFGPKTKLFIGGMGY